MIDGWSVIYTISCNISSQTFASWSLSADKHVLVDISRSKVVSLDLRIHMGRYSGCRFSRDSDCWAWRSDHTDLSPMEVTSLVHVPLLYTTISKICFSWNSTLQVEVGLSNYDESICVCRQSRIIALVLNGQAVGELDFAVSAQQASSLLPSSVRKYPTLFCFIVRQELTDAFANHSPRPCAAYPTCAWFQTSNLVKFPPWLIQVFGLWF